jgi:hypothetical protein
VKPVDGDGEEKANFREAGDGIGPAEDHESVLDNDEKVVEIHTPDLKGKPLMAALRARSSSRMR